MAEYVVVKTHNFDPETEAAKFDDYRKATAYLQWFWEDYYNDEMGEDSDLDEDECYHEEDYAKVQWSDGSRTEFHLIRIDTPRKNFPSDWERYAV